jgi:acyl-CoA thioester hydrolase
MEALAMKTKTFATSFRVRYQETDQMGVAHHSVYAAWFEVGRTEMIRQLGISYKEMEEQGVLLPVVDLHCRFLQPARYDDEITVITRVLEAVKAKLTFGYEVIRTVDDVLLTTGKTIHLWVDHEMKRVNFERRFPEVFRILSAQIDESQGKTKR